MDTSRGGLCHFGRLVRLKVNTERHGIILLSWKFLDASRRGSLKCCFDQRAIYIINNCHQVGELVLDPWKR